jgi:hypothetical protein
VSCTHASYDQTAAEQAARVSPRDPSVVSRRRTSPPESRESPDDNPYSEAQFKTLKYRPDFPERFGAIEDSRSFCGDFFGWYNFGHHHSGLAMLTPADVHHGRVELRVTQNQATLDAAYAAHPGRFVHGPPVARRPPTEVWINKPTSPEAASAPRTSDSMLLQ